MVPDSGPPGKAEVRTARYLSPFCCARERKEAWLLTYSGKRDGERVRFLRLDLDAISMEACTPWTWDSEAKLQSSPGAARGSGAPPRCASYKRVRRSWS